MLRVKILKVIHTHGAAVGMKTRFNSIQTFIEHEIQKVYNLLTMKPCS